MPVKEGSWHSVSFHLAELSLVDATVAGFLSFPGKTLSNITNTSKTRIRKRIGTLSLRWFEPVLPHFN